ncbi:MAG: CmcJ/NvfI family oxidoreductase, partial [Pseudomonadota bacterium]
MSDMATVNYHVRSNQPQAFFLDADGIAGRLESPELVPTRVAVQDLRTNGSSLQTVNFESDGVTFVEHRSEIKQFEDDSAWQTVYDAELQGLLAREIGAVEVVVFDHTLRTDSESAIRRPARNVHNDYTPQAAEQRLTDVLGSERAQRFSNGHYGFVNVWRPVEQPVMTSPLGFIRPRSMQPEDWVTIDLVYTDRKGEILGVAANQHHEWLYRSQMTPDEVVIFNTYDNDGL